MKEHGDEARDPDCRICGGTVIRFKTVDQQERIECERCGYGWTDGVADPKGEHDPEAAKPISAECWWVILHHDHHAWYQRSLMKGDFRPGLTPRSDYIVDADGRAADPTATPTCSTCGEVPDVDDLDPIERLTGESGALDRHRLDPKRYPWPDPTNHLTCWYCNGRETADPARVAAASVAARRAARAAAMAKRSGRPDTTPPEAPIAKEALFLCDRCDTHLKLEAARQANEKKEGGRDGVD